MRGVQGRDFHRHTRWDSKPRSAELSGCSPSPGQRSRPGGATATGGRGQQVERSAPRRPPQHRFPAALPGQSDQVLPKFKPRQRDFFKMNPPTPRFS